jgi:hypothetical protein
MLIFYENYKSVVSSGFDSVAFNGREGLSVSLGLSIPLSPSELENKDFLRPVLFNDMRPNGNVFQQGLPDADRVGIGKHKNLVKGDGIPNRSGDFFNPQNLVFFHPVLFSTGSNYRVHDNSLLF